MRQYLAIQLQLQLQLQVQRVVIYQKNSGKAGYHRRHAPLRKGGSMILELRHGVINALDLLAGDPLIKSGIRSHIAIEDRNPDLLVKRFLLRKRMVCPY